MTVTISCPLDDLPMTPATLEDGPVATATPLGEVEKEALVGKHIHVQFDSDFVCEKGHRWHMANDLTMERVA